MQNLQQTMSAREFSEWQEYYKLEPFGDDWLQSAVIASSIVNLFSKKRRSVEEFMPPPMRQAKTTKQTEEELTKFALRHNKSEARKAGSRPCPR